MLHHADGSHAERRHKPQGIDWASIRSSPPPFVPHLSSITDTAYFPVDELADVPDDPTPSLGNGTSTARHGRDRGRTHRLFLIVVRMCLGVHRAAGGHVHGPRHCVRRVHVQALRLPHTAQRDLMNGADEWSGQRVLRACGVHPAQCVVPSFPFFYKTYTAFCATQRPLFVAAPFYTDLLDGRAALDARAFRRLQARVHLGRPAALRAR